MKKQNTDMLHPIQNSICSKVGIRHLLQTFLVLSILASVHLLSSVARLSDIVDVSKKMKADALDVVRAFMDVNTAETFYLQYGDKNITVTDAIVSRNNTKERPSHANVSIEQNMTESTKSTRKEWCDNCFKHDFNYLIENEIICKLTSSDQKIDVLILIFTIQNNTQERNALRTTWLTYSKRNTANMRYAFLLGKTNNSQLDDIVLAESKQFNDIITEDFVDSYMNLTYKTIMGLKWAATKCSHAHYVMKTDDDMFVNIPNLIKLVQEHGQSLQTAIVGSCSESAKPIRNKKSKWYARYSSYPRSTYPTYCSGTGYITSMHVAKTIYEISTSVPFFHLEDIYVALCAKKLRLKMINYNGFNRDKPELDPCIYKGQTLVTAHRLPPLLLKGIWQRKCIIPDAKLKR